VRGLDGGAALIVGTAGEGRTSPAILNSITSSNRHPAANHHPAAIRRALAIHCPVVSRCPLEIRHSAVTLCRTATRYPAAAIRHALATRRSVVAIHYPAATRRSVAIHCPAETDRLAPIRCPGSFSARPCYLRGLQCKPSAERRKPSLSGRILTEASAILLGECQRATSPRRRNNTDAVPCRPSCPK
jgi:hypothetical protein